MFAKFEVATHAHIDLGERRTAKLIKGSLLAIHHSTIICHSVAINVHAGSQRERASTFKL